MRLLKYMAGTWGKHSKVEKVSFEIVSQEQRALGKVPLLFKCDKFYYLDMSSNKSGTANFKDQYSTLVLLIMHVSASSEKQLFILAARYSVDLS